MSDEPLPGEFELIERVFAPLAKGYANAFGLKDDAALVAVADGARQVVTVDTLIASVHFLDDDPPDLVARKLLRVNLSDLAAKGAKPVGYLLAASFAKGTTMAWIEGFAAGLAADQEEFGIKLIGGDTTTTPGPATFSVTMIGEVAGGTMTRRATARAGEAIYVSGTIGDAALGVDALQGKLSGLDAITRRALADRYRLPRPRMRLGLALNGIASAAADISDGLVADLGHICDASSVSAEFEIDLVPLSDAARLVVGGHPKLVERVVTGGDDYEIVFTVPRTNEDAARAAAERAEVQITRIGQTRSGKGVTVLGADGAPLKLRSTGYRHL